MDRVVSEITERRSAAGAARAERLVRVAIPIERLG